MNRYTLAVLVRNQFGVLNRLTSMFRRRQFNISSITASETESAEFSRITFSFDSEEECKAQLVNQLYKLPDVCSIKELTNENSLSCELMLIKLKNDPAAREEIHSAAEAFKAETIDYSRDYVTGPKIITEETKKTMKKILKNIQDGTFAKEFLLDMSDAGSQVHFNAMRKIASEHPSETEHYITHSV